MRLCEIADKGDNLETLKQLRHKLAETIEESRSGRDIASLSRQLQIVMGAIEELEEKQRNETDDSILELIRSRHPTPVRNSRGISYYEVSDDDDSLYEDSIDTN